MSKLSTEQRNQLTDSDFGIPEKRMYPLHDKAHVESAVKLFGHAETKYKKSLARKILSRAREYGMDTSGWKQVLTFAQEQVPPMSNGTSIGNSPPRLMAPYYDEQDELLERVNDLDGAADPFVFAKRIVSAIHDQVEKDSKPPTGNQNCQLCTWCAEAWYRNMQVLPRPVYSPRDPALEIKGETIVANPIKKRFSSQREVVETVRGNIDSRWYVHVNWKDSAGGHEFLIVNIKDYAYIMDAQAGLLKEIDETDSTNSYFRDINFDNSYMVRLDDKPFNTRLFNEMNDPAKVLPWNHELDVPYMKEHDMLGDMSDKWTMRPATEADLEFVYFSELETVGENKNDPKVQKYIREDAKESLGHTQIIVAENSDIGVYQAYATDYYGLREGKKDWWYLAHIYIKPEYRTLGIGSAIIKRDIAEHDKILLQVMKSNTRAKKLYESLGFVVDMENDHGGLVMRIDKSKSKAAQESFIEEMLMVPFTDYEESINLMYIIESDVQQNPNNGNWLQRVIQWCRNAVQFIIDKIRNLFGKNTEVKTNVDINALNQQAHNTMVQIENGQPVDINKLDQQLATFKNPYEIKNVQEAVKQINANIALINKTLNKDGLDQQTVTVLQKLLNAYMTALKDIQNNQQASQGDKTIIEALKKSILTNNANGSSNIQVYPYLYSRTYYIDFDSIGLVFPTELIKNPSDASKYVLQCVKSFGSGIPQFNSSVTYYNGFYTVLIHCLAAQLAEKVGYKPETFTTERGETRKKFLNDVVGRSMQICIGYIVSADEIKKNGIPAVSYQMLWNIYLKAQEHSFFVPEGNIADENKKRRISSSLVTIKSNPIPQNTNPSTNKENIKQESFMDEYEKRVNDKGDPVPDKCKCGGKISITLKGEPIYSCESCGKYYGTVPCNIQEGDIPKHDNTLIPVKDFPYDTVYRGSYDGHIDTNPLYVTPFKGLASIFAARDAIRPKLRELGLRVYNMDYDEWKLKPSELMKPFTTVHVKIQSKEGKTFEPFEIEATGDVYTFDVSNLKDKIYRYNWMDPDKEALVVDYGEIQMPKAERVTVKYIVEPDASFTQEGAFQDLKNGVNPYSDDLVFHVSPDKHIDGQVWQPRVPDYLDPYNPEDTGFEDNTTPRICFSTSIEGALNGITVNLQRQSPDTFDKMYVYVPEKPWKEYKHKTNKELVKNKLVYDANVTREVWIMEPVRMKLYGVIRVDQIADAKRKTVVPTSKGQKDKRNYFTYKWHWVVKPKVLKKATKFDYSPERVIDDLCVDVKKFKYGLIKDGRLMTGNVSDADYDTYWVFHSGETVDQAGGGNCYDMVEYEAGYLEAFGVPYKKYYMNFTDTKNTKTINTHTICVVPHNGKFIYIEQAFKRIVDEWGYERKKVFDKLTDIFEYIAEVTAEYENQDLNYGVWDYTNAEIDYGTPIKNFMEWIMSKCKMIHDGEATKLKPIKEGYRMNRFGRFYTEAKKEEEMLSDDMEDITIGDLELDGDKSDDTEDEKISIKDTNIDDDGSLPEEGDFDQYRDDDDDERIEKARGPIDDVPEYLKDRLSDDDLRDFEQPDENLNADNVDLGQFGTDQSDVQNDYDPKEIEVLMKLMASEADALGEYLDAAKETNIDVLRRLYADIGNEERFHMEQLLFAKSELTGEKYVPKDPEVKSEYEELLKMGMDEETAMQTAVDKCHIRGSISEDDEDERMEIQADVETMEMTINMFNQLYDNVYTVMESGTPKEVDHAFEIFVEATYDSTAASSAQSALSETKKFGPIQLIRTTLRFLVKTLMTIIRKFVSLCKRIHNRSREIKRFIKQYGFAAIFSSKIKMYFVNFNNPYLVDDSLETLLALSVDTVNASLRSAGFQEMQQPYKRNPRMNIGGNVKRGIELLNGVQLVKSAMVLPENEADRERIAEAFFGYSDQKGPDGKSVNTVNRMQWICDEWCRFMEYVDKITTQFDSLAQQQQSIYYTNKAKYDTAMKGLETVTKTCKAVVSAMQYDIETMIKLNNDAATQAANMSDTAAKDDQYNKQKQAYEQSHLVTTQCPFCGKTIKGQPNLLDQELMKHVKTSHADIPNVDWVVNNMRKKNNS